MPSPPDNNQLPGTYTWNSVGHWVLHLVTGSSLPLTYLRRASRREKNHRNSDSHPQRGSVSKPRPLN